jgi:hypothetical protein
MKLTTKQVNYFIKKKNLDMSREIFTKKDLFNGIKVELEHGKINRETNVTNDNIMMTGFIALAHLREFPDYYERLEKLERSAKKYWKKRSKKRTKKSKK